MVRSSTIVLTLTLAATAFAAPLSLERRSAPMEEHEQFAMRSEMDAASLEKRFDFMHHLHTALSWVKSNPKKSAAGAAAVVGFLGHHIWKKKQDKALTNAQPARQATDGEVPDESPTDGGSGGDASKYRRRDLQDDDEYLLEMRDMEDNTPWVVLRDANMEYVASTLEKRGSLSDME
ncbi:hypothetical protein DACRYDRAFT_109020 [Dacryopinax primogenitus]|uniref:RxLR effector protein n=1 Tax=Dacryopinax primogenitus (strain DJM 731) TaxID=1858805 RepID=M5FSB1_DACPD|nr:uncharacterized protein DACRYDRAFT_109020 [Dacryopinax primogenitus]EJU00281.1 hypothetical protein DACRYDRAFT_109020 [Dacryopinax primogenitus]